MFTTQEIIEITGSNKVLLHRWASAGIVVPAVAGKPGRGRTSKYSFPQAVALVYASQLAKEGWRPVGLTKVLQNISKMPDRELNDKIDKDCTLPIAPGVWISPSKQNLSREELALVRRVDISRPYQKVMDHMRRVLREVAHS